MTSIRPDPPPALSPRDPKETVMSPTADRHPADPGSAENLTTRPSDSPERAYIVHGYGANITSHWFPWLTDRLEANGTRTNVIRLPNPPAPDVDDWHAAVADTIGRPDSHTALIGHSLGCATLIRFLSGLDHSWNVRSLVLVSGFVGPLANLPELDEFTAALDRPELLHDIASATHRCTVVRSDDDPIVDAEATDHLAAELNAELVVIPGAGHFLDQDGWTELPVLLEYI